MKWKRRRAAGHDSYYGQAEFMQLRAQFCDQRKCYVAFFFTLCRIARVNVSVLSVQTGRVQPG